MTDDKVLAQLLKHSKSLTQALATQSQPEVIEKHWAWIATAWSTHCWASNRKKLTTHHHRARRISRDQFERLIHACKGNSAPQIRDRLVLLLLWHLRMKGKNGILVLNVKDIACQQDGSVQVHLPNHMPIEVERHVNPLYDLGIALREWLSISAITDGRLVRGIHYGCNKVYGEITDHSLRRLIAEAQKRAKINGRPFTLYSFRLSTIVSPKYIARVVNRMVA